MTAWESPQLLRLSRSERRTVLLPTSTILTVTTIPMQLKRYAILPQTHYRLGVAKK